MTSPPSPQAIIRCRGITKSFGTGEATVAALRGVDLDVYGGEFLLLVGPSGCGKTTLLSIIGAMLDRDGGECAVMGRDPEEMGRSATAPAFAANPSDSFSRDSTCCRRSPPRRTFRAAADRWGTPSPGPSAGAGDARRRRARRTPGRLAGTVERRPAAARRHRARPRARARGSSCATSPRAISTMRPAPRWSTCCDVPGEARIGPWSSRPTTRASSGSRTAWRTWRTAGSWTSSPRPRQGAQP